MVSMATLRVGNLAIGLVLLIFMISGLSLVFSDLEDGLGVSGISSDLDDVNSNSGLESDGNTFNSEFSAQVDDAEDLAPSDDQQIEDRAASTSGVLNLFSKNIIVKFIDEASGKLGIIPNPVIVLLISLLSVIVTILVARFFMGADRT